MVSDSYEKTLLNQDILVDCTHYHCTYRCQRNFDIILLFEIVQCSCGSLTAIHVRTNIKNISQTLPISCPVQGTVILWVY